LEIVAADIHEISGATLVLAYKNGAYGIGWAAPWQRRISAYHTRPDEKSARRLFEDMYENNPPATPSLCRDWQRNAVYAWEESTLDRTDTRMKPAEMEQVIRRIASDFNLAAAPTIEYRKPAGNAKNPASYYEHEREHIRMANRKLSHILHEAAHAIDMQKNGNVWAGHGPSFVRTLITLAERYQPWHDPAHLEKTARQAGLAVAPKSAMKFDTAKPRRP
jgi:hypothetical protein